MLIRTPLSFRYCPQQDIVDLCKSKGILIEAYSPLGSTGSPLFQEEGVQEVAKKHNVGPGTILISYQGTFSSSAPSLVHSTDHWCSQQGPMRSAKVRHSISDRGELEDGQARLLGYGRP